MAYGRIYKIYIDITVFFEKIDLKFHEIPEFSLYFNTEEQNIFKNFVQADGKVINDIWVEAQPHIRSGEWIFKLGTRDVDLDKASCIACAKQIFGMVIEKVRFNIDREKLPDEIKRKPDCYWGKI